MVFVNLEVGIEASRCFLINSKSAKSVYLWAFQIIDSSSVNIYIEEHILHDHTFERFSFDWKLINTKNLCQEAVLGRFLLFFDMRQITLRELLKLNELLLLDGFDN